MAGSIPKCPSVWKLVVIKPSQNMIYSQLKPEQESQNKIVKLQHIGSILFWRLGCTPSTFTRFGFKIPVLGATISDGEGATSCEKYSQVPQISTAVSPIWKLPAVFVVIKSGVPKHDLFPTETKT